MEDAKKPILSQRQYNMNEFFLNSHDLDFFMTTGDSSHAQPEEKPKQQEQKTKQSLMSKICQCGSFLNRKPGNG